MNFSLTQRRKGAKVRVLKVQFGNFIPQYGLRHAGYQQREKILLIDNFKSQFLIIKLAYLAKKYSVEDNGEIQDYRDWRFCQC
jgi:hypothetical protein